MNPTAPRPLTRLLAVTATVFALVGALVGLSARAADAAPADAPGAPGAAATWTTGDKEGLGTSQSSASKVWYTLTGGTMSEVYYPSGVTPNVRELQLAVTDGATWTQLETDATVTRTVTLADRSSLTYQQTSTDKQGRWRLTKTYITDPARPTVLVDVKFERLKPGALQLFTVYDPSLSGDAGNDSGATTGTALTSSDTHDAQHPVGSALVSSAPFIATSTGYVGTSDGTTVLRTNHTLAQTYAAAGPGNIAQVGQLPLTGDTTSLTLALGFGPDSAAALKTANASLRLPYRAQQALYQAGWKIYLSTLNKAPKGLDDKLTTQYWASVMTVKAHEDKTYPGAFIASLTIPWGQAVNASGEGGAGNGYHFVWARDAYEQVTGLLAAGDTRAAKDAVTWLFTRQQQADGHFPQNSAPDGTPDQTNVQLDETAYPIILAQQVGGVTKAMYTDHIAKAADYLVAHGPTTPQERWEETGGYSPSTIADMIAGLTAAADLATKAGDAAGAAVYQATADEWQRNVEKWTYTTTGSIRDGQYYIRISGSGNPNDGAVRNWANGAGAHPENAITDAGFLELTRLGVKAPNDPYVEHSLLAVDDSLKVSTPSGDLFKRYTFDGYGETADGAPWTGVGIGRPWPLLSGERGEYELGRGRNALPYLRTMANTANAGYMIPEQAWDQADPTAYNHVFGKGTGSAAPLSWAMSQYVRLAQGIGAGKVVETPSVVADRYARQAPPAAPQLSVTSPADLSTATSRTITVSGTTTATSVYLSVNGVKQQVAVNAGAFSTQVTLPSISNQLVIAAVGANGGTAQVVRTVTAFGARVGGVSDPAGDDNGPGSYVYPTDGAFNAGSFDLTKFDVYQDGGDIRLVTTIQGAINNPWGGNGMSTQRLNIYVKGGADSTSTPLLPGSNMNAAGAWSRAIVADGRHETGTYGEGVYGPDLTKVGAAELKVLPTTRQVVVTMPAAALGGVDLATAGYQVSIFSDADDTEGIGNIRPVYSLDCWNANGCPTFIKQFRFGGGAGVWNADLATVDSNTSDPNAIDVISGSAAQSEVLDWTRGAPVVVPYVGITP